jgi:hypothetical protein
MTIEEAPHLFDLRGLSLIRHSLLLIHHRRSPDLYLLCASSLVRHSSFVIRH